MDIRGILKSVTEEGLRGDLVLPRLFGAPQEFFRADSDSLDN